MKLSEVFTQLSYGELSQISIGTSTSGEITEENYDRILIHINLGLTNLYKRFNLKEGRFTVELQSGMFTYPLTTAFAQSNTKSKEQVKFIDDSQEKFKDDLFKVERVYSSSGFEFKLNDIDDPWSLITSSYNILRVPQIIVGKGNALPDKMKTDTLDIVYRANHPLIVNNGSINPATYELELPYSHLEALLLFVASRINNPIGLGQEFNAGNTYAAKYEAECQRLEQQNLQVDKNTQNTRLERNGWV